MLLPPLTDWDETRRGLHAAAQVIGAVRAAVAEPLPNYAHLGLAVDPAGLTTGPLPGVGELALDFAAGTLLYTPPDREPAGFALIQHTQRSLANAVDAGLAGEEQMIGQSGVRVSPDLYLALGISGDLQHTVGLEGAKTVVAVNRDPNAAIFGRADHGLVADLREFLPVLLEVLAGPVETPTSGGTTRLEKKVHW